MSHLLIALGAPIAYGFLAMTAGGIHDLWCYLDREPDSAPAESFQDMIKRFCAESRND